MSSTGTNRTIAHGTTFLLAAAGLLLACNRDTEPTAPGTAAPRPDLAQEAMDVAQLVPAPVELATPMVCGPITVYDQEDAETLCSPSTLAATPITLPTCPQEAAGSVRLEVDLVCAETSGLIVTSDNTVIDLNGHKIACLGTGYMGSCQGRAPPAEFDDQRGIDTNGHDNVHVFSHLPGGTIDGFDQGVHVRRGSDNVKVKQLIITGPPATNGPRSGITRGVFVDGAACGDGHVRIGGGSNTGNDISNHHRGVEAFQSACVYIGYNQVHDNQGGGSANGVGGIFITSSSDSHIRSNLVTRNGDGDRNLDAGIRLSDPPTTGNLVVENQANENNPYGVRTAVFAADNYIVNNQMLGNVEFDVFSDQTSVNQWNENNRCIRQTTPEPPPGVCSPDEVPPPK